MRNYCQFFFRLFNSGGLNIGRTQEECDALSAGFLQFNPGATVVQEGKLYLNLSKDNLYVHLHNSYVVTGQIFSAGSATVWNFWNLPGFVVERSDFLEIESPRGPERRRFRLVPIKHVR